MQGSYKPTVVALITVVTLAPFLNNAFHVDDPLFIWMAPSKWPNIHSIPTASM
jgi:hypothetical protein